MIAFTNHALDHMLTSVLDADITQKVVRLGSRSADERIQKFSIEAMEEVAGRSRIQREFASSRREVKEVENKLLDLTKQCVKTAITPDDILRYLEVEFPVFYEDFIHLPGWIDLLYNAQRDSMQDGGAFTRVGKGGRDEASDYTALSYWLSGEDLQFLTLAHNPPSLASHLHPAEDAASSNPFAILAKGNGDDPENAVESSDTSSVRSAYESLIEDFADSDIDDELPPEEAWMLISQDAITEDSDVDETHPQPPEPLPPSDHNPPVVSIQTPDRSPPPSASSPSIPTTSTHLRPGDFEDLQAFFTHCGYSNTPLLPSLDRPIAALLEIDNVWDMSLAERIRLHEHWVHEVRLSIQETSIREYEDLRQKYLEALTKDSEGKAAVRFTLGTCHDMMLNTIFRPDASCCGTLILLDAQLLVGLQ